MEKNDREEGRKRGREKEVCESQRSQMTQEYINLQRNCPSLSRSPVTNDGERMMKEEERGGKWRRKRNGEEKRRRKRDSFWYREKYDNGCGEGKISFFFE